MKTARTVLLIAFVVLANVFTASLLAPFVFAEEMLGTVMSLGLGAFALAVLVSIACIVVAAASHGSLAAHPDQQQGLGLQVFVCKLLMIPYFVVTFLYTVMLVFASSLLTVSIHLASMGFILGAMTAVIIPVLTVANILFLLATSSFSISNIVLEYRKGLTSFSNTVILVILQVIPIADVASYGFIIRSFRKKKTERGLL